MKVREALILVAGIIASAGTSAWAHEPPRADVSVGYAILRERAYPGLWHTYPVGWVASGSWWFGSAVAVVAEVGGSYRRYESCSPSRISNCGDFTYPRIHSFLAGGRVSTHSASRVAAFVQVVGGMTDSRDGFGEADLALQPGLGFDVRVTERTKVRWGGDYRVVYGEYEPLKYLRFHVGVAIGFRSD